MSWEAIEVGRPALLSSFPSSFEEDLHSGPVSSIFSLTTYPQLLQTSSPLSESKTMGPFPHLGHLSRALWSLSLRAISFSTDNMENHICNTSLGCIYT